MRKLALLILALVCPLAVFAQGSQNVKGTYGAGAPSSSNCPGDIGAQYVDTSANQLYVITAISRTSSSTTCTWTQAGGSSGSVDVAVFTAGTNTNSQKLLRIALTRQITFPASATLSQATASANATGSTVYTLTKNGVSFATVTFSGGSATGTWTQASSTTFAAGDVLEIDGPATADATLADVGITLAGCKGTATSCS